VLVGGSTLVGVLAGLAVAALDAVVGDGLLPQVLGADLWVAACCPLVGLMASLAVRRLVPEGVSPATADEYIRSVHDPSHTLPLRALATRTAATMITVGSGVPMGLEGPALYAGGAIGSNVDQRLPRANRPGDHRHLLIAGGAGGVAAIFKAPLTAAVFAMEVPYKRQLAHRSLVPALIGSVAGYFTFAALRMGESIVAVADAASYGARDLGGFALLGACAGVAARLFARLLRSAKQLAAQPRPVGRAAIAGLLLAAAFAAGRGISGESLLIGPGYDVIRWAATPNHALLAIAGILILRCVATATAIAGGGTGGVFIPLLVGGALIGSLIGSAIEADNLTLYVVVGAAAFLGAGYGVPLAAVVFIVETTGRLAFVIPALVAAGVATLIMRGSSVTSFQRDPEHRPTDRNRFPHDDR
jgi:chloride channel protein, CIC family